MSNNRNDQEPMLSIPSMEELDRQWREMQAANATQKKTNSNNRRPEASQRPVKKANPVKAKESTGTKAKGKKRKKEKKPKKFRKLRMFLKVFFLILLLAILAAVVVFYVKYGDDLLKWKNEASKQVAESSKATFRSSQTSIVYASNKKVIAKLKGDKDSYYLEFDKIPKMVVNCMLVTEDRDFYNHSGVNLLSTAKAAAMLVKAKMTGQTISRGGSTITQQLAKNVYLSPAKTYERKIREMFYAMDLERKYTKDEIMEFYINNIYFANGYYGIEAASKAYFSKTSSELSIAETAFLCSIPNRPNTYNPLEHYDNTINRKNRILKQLLDEKMISAAEYNDAVYEEIVLKPAKQVKTQNYMTTYAVSCATKALMKKQGFAFRNQFDSDEDRKAYEKEYNSVYDECHTALYTGGYRIYTSLSTSKQNKLQSKVDTTLAGFTEKSKNGMFALQGAATCIDNKTGFVVAIVGGRKQKSITGYTLNRGFQSYRQPGSCFKPLVVYTPQLESGRGYTPSTLVDDTYFEGGPKNSSGTYMGKIPLRTAVEKSKNVVAWKLFTELKPKVGLSYVLNMNFAKIVPNDYYPAASLGGLTNGASTVEMASGYAAIENDGVYREPTCVTKIVDFDGNVVVNNKKSQEKKRVYEETASRMMTDILSGVLIRGTGAGKGLSNMACAGKTGTTSDKKDGWFCGYTPYYTTAVWVGYDAPRTLNDLYGSTYPLTIWHDFMEEIHTNLERKEFEKYQGESDINDKDHVDDQIDDEQPGEEPTIAPEDGEPTEAPDEEEPDVTKAPAVTKKPVVTQAPAATPQDTPIPQNPDDPPADVPDGEDTPDDIPDEGGEE